MADQDEDSTLPSLPSQRQKVSDSFKNNVGPNQPSLWQRITGATPTPTPEDKMKAVQKRISGGSEGF